MRRARLCFGIVLGAFLLCLSSGVFASDQTDFGSADFLTQADRIKNFLFGPAMRVTGIIGGAYGLVQATLSSSIKPLLVYGGIGLAVNLIPKFIDGVYSVSGMLVP